MSGNSNDEAEVLIMGNPNEIESISTGGSSIDSLEDYSERIATVPNVPKIKGKSIGSQMSTDYIEKKEKEMQKILDALRGLKKAKEEKTTKPAEPPQKLLKAFDVKLDSRKIVFPIPGMVPHPLLYVNDNKNFQIRVASIDWIHALAEMRTRGWPAFGQLSISDFKKRSAEVVQRDCRMTVIEAPANQKEKANMISAASGSDGKDQPALKNRIERFAKWWPDPSRMNKNLKANWERLFRDIRAQDPGAWLPQQKQDPKSKSVQMTCPTKPFDFQYTYNGEVKTAKNFLRHATFFDPNKKTLALYGTSGVKEVSECSPKPGEEYSWIPKEHLQVAEAYGLNEYWYMPPEKWNEYLYNVADAKVDGETSLMRTYDREKKVHCIFVQFPDGGAYKVYLGKVKLQTPACPKKDDKTISLQDFCDLFCNDHEDQGLYETVLYPLIHIIFNAEPPLPGSMSHYSKHIEPHVWEATVKTAKGTEKKQRMYPSAPFVAFQKYIIEKFATGFLPSDTHDELVEKFIRNFWNHAVQIPLYKFGREYIDEPHPLYASILKSFFEFGGHTGHTVEDIKYEASIAPNVIGSVQTPTKENLQKIQLIDTKTLSKLPLDVKKIIGAKIGELWQKKYKPQF